MFEENPNRQYAGGDDIMAAAPRRERLERIANAERDRRAGRTGMAIAAIGEPAEWPARVVLALAYGPEITGPDSEGAKSQGLLLEGLDLWARDFELGSLDSAVTANTSGEASPETAPTSPEDLARPIEAAELDHAFAFAETEVESMRDVNDVAERILADEPTGLAELSGSALENAEHLDAASPIDFYEMPSRAAEEQSAKTPLLHKNRGRHLATLEGWLSNIERRRAGRAV